MTWPTRHDLHIYRGDDFARTITFADADGDAIDVSARTFSAQIRTTTEAGSSTAAFTVGTSGAASGTITLTLAKATTAALTPGTYTWDLRQVVSSVETTLLAGSVHVKGDVTR